MHLKKAEQPNREQIHSFITGLLKDILLLVVLPVLAVSFITSYIVLLTYVPTSSMEPTIRVGDLAVVNRLAYIGDKTPERGDIVVFAKTGDDKMYVKRVIATEGETVSFSGGDVYIDGELLEENYTAVSHSTYPKTADTYTVPEGCIFLLGDNRESSKDSRRWDNPFISTEQVYGRVIMLK